MEDVSIPLQQDEFNDNYDVDSPDRHRRIIICCDGTWNDRETNQPLTNVTRIQSCIAVRDVRYGESFEQLSYYIDGIGAGTTWGGAIHDGSTGSGIERKIREAYRHLCLTYTNSKDEIILIGFSRGAFTVRCLAALIHNVGLLDGAWVNKELPAIFELWKNHDQNFKSSEGKSSPLAQHCQKLREKYDKPGQRSRQIFRQKVSIKACAVWDTVKSLGFPWPKGLPHPESKKYHFVNYRLTPNIDTAFQALSLDERRWHFLPVIWSKSHARQSLKQCWFLGSHSDIGGGYRNAGFANISLCWMISRLKDFIRFDEKAIWHSTEDGRILGIDVAKENKEMFNPERGRTQKLAKQQQPRQKAKSSSPSSKTNRNSILPASIQPLWSRVNGSQRSGKEPLTTRLEVPSIIEPQRTAEQRLIAEGWDSEVMPRSSDEPDFLVLPGSDMVTPDGASLNPEAEASSIQDGSYGASSDTSDAESDDESPRRNQLAIKDIKRHTRSGLWMFGGLKTRKIGVHRTADDDSRTPDGKPPWDAEKEFAGSNESIHFSVRVLTQMYAVQERKRCRALKKFELIEGPEKTVWRCAKGRPEIRDIPEDIAEEYEQSMLHRWLDRDFAAKETSGGKRLWEATAGSNLVSAPTDEPLAEQGIPLHGSTPLYRRLGS